MNSSSYFTNKKGGDRIFSVEAPKIKFGRGALNEMSVGSTATSSYTTESNPFDFRESITMETGSS